MNQKRKSIWLSHIERESLVNGPGIRTVIWLQGCSLHCKGCFNPSLHAFYKGKQYQIKALAEALSELRTDGLTISGGEPLDQNKELFQLIRYYKFLTKKTVLLFTGYSYDQIKKSPKKLRTILNTDAVLCGSFREGPIWNHKQLILMTNQIDPQNLKPHSDIELSIKSGQAFLTGYPYISRRRTQYESR